MSKIDEVQKKEAPPKSKKGPKAKTSIFDDDPDLSEGEKEYNNALVQYLASCHKKKREYEMKKVEKYRDNGLRYPIPGFTSSKPEESSMFVIDKKAEPDKGIDEAVKRKREDLI